MIEDWARAIAQCMDRRFLMVLIKGVGLTLLLLFGFTALMVWTVGLVVPDSFHIWFIGEITWIDNVASWAVVPVMIFASVFLMIPVAAAFSGLFLDEVADAVEGRHYQHLPAVSHIPFSESIGEVFRFLFLLLGANILAFLLAIVFAPVAPFIFWGVNGLLLGREYATMVARRRLGRKEVYAFRKRHRMEIWLSGVVMAVPLSIPIMNLVIPILGVAAFTHLFHRLRPT